MNTIPRKSGCRGGDERVRWAGGGRKGGEGVYEARDEGRGRERQDYMRGGAKEWKGGVKEEV